MPEPTDQAPQRQRRANRVGLRTLRQRPKLVGRLANGEPVYEVRSIRLVLRGQTPHFNRLVACERCGQDQAGAPVLSLADLDLPIRPMICADCVQRAGVSSVWEPEATRPPPERVTSPAAPAPVPAQPEPAPAAPTTDDGRLESMERRLEAVGARVEELSRVTEAQLAAQSERRRAEEATLAALRAAMSQALAGARAEIAAVSDESATRLAFLERSLREGLAALTQEVEAQRVDLTAVVGEVMRSRSETQVADGATAEVAAAASSFAADMETLQAVVDERLRDLAARVAQGMARIDAMVDESGESTSRLAGLEERLDRVVGELAIERAALQTSRPSDGGNGVRLMDDLELQLQGASDRLAALSGGSGGEQSEPREG